MAGRPIFRLELETRNSPYFRVEYGLFRYLLTRRKKKNEYDSDTHLLVKYPTSRKPWYSPLITSVTIRTPTFEGIKKGIKSY